MLTDVNTTVAPIPPTGQRRQFLFGLLLIAASPATRIAWANTASDATATVERFNMALLAAMKAGGQTDFGYRFQALAPAVDQAFDLSSVLAVSVGLGWPSLSQDQQGRLLDAFRRYTVASYVANFDNYAGQTFAVLPGAKSLDAHRVIVKSCIQPVSGDATELDYVMKQTPPGWKVVDVLAAGSISRVAVQRSDFRHLLSKGGGDALLASLQRKTSELSGGAVT